MPPAKSGLEKYLPELRRPFTEHAVKFKIQTGKPGGKAMVITYHDSRLVGERLNWVCPGEWEDEYLMPPWWTTAMATNELICRLTVAGITRQDLGVLEPGSQGGSKGLYSDAFKRAGVKFGIGAHLYATPRMQVGPDGYWVRQATQGRPAKIGGLTDQALVWCQKLYADWLKTSHGFGQPLSHGDAPDAQGDVEVDVEATEDSEPDEPRERPAPSSAPKAGKNPDQPADKRKVTAAQIRKLWANANDLGLNETEVHYILVKVAKTEHVNEMEKQYMDSMLTSIADYGAWKKGRLAADKPVPEPDLEAAKVALKASQSIEEAAAEMVAETLAEEAAEDAADGYSG